MKTWIRAALGLSLATGATFSASSAHAGPIYGGGSWEQGDDGPSPLADSTNNLCWLTRVTGRFVGGGESVHVYESGGYWYISGGSEQQGVAGTATCVPYDTFIPENGGVKNWTDSFYVNTGLAVISPVGTPDRGAAQLGTWQGDAAIMIDGITGEFDGGGEFVEVDQANAPLFDLLTAGAESWNGVGGWAGTFFVGIPGTGFVPSFYGPGVFWPRAPNAGPTSEGEAGEYSASSAAGYYPQTTIMASANEAICYFSRISGAFFGGGEYAEISTTDVNGEPYWALTVGSEQLNGTSASARCYAFNQNPEDPCTNACTPPVSACVNGVVSTCEPATTGCNEWVVTGKCMSQEP